uniref:Rho GDP-dissociation inhibitor n=1 Tax=Haptolina brevifila TaxID=156173 RepID=A0A7S2BBE4_9EUKA
MADLGDASSANQESEREEGYVAPPPKSLEELMSSEGKEGEDEALQRYKASLLGAAAAGGGMSDDPRRVVVTKLEIVINGRDSISVDMTQQDNLSGNLSIKLKEGCEYKTQISFRVQNELIAGLKYKNKVSRGPLNVLTTDEMLGSFAPDPEKENVAVFPRREWEDAPSGMMARATYNCKTEFIDDDGKTHLAFSYKLVISKDW